MTTVVKLSKAEIGQNIRALRETLGLDQAEMAEKIGAYQSAVSKWERGENEPKGENRKALCDFLKTPWKDLAYSDNKPTMGILEERLDLVESKLKQVDQTPPSLPASLLDALSALNQEQLGTVESFARKLANKVANPLKRRKGLD